SQPTELELQFLKILWERAPLPVREIREALCERGRDIAHTSVITTLNTMVQKKYLKRVQQGNTYYFSPAVSRDTMSQRIVGHVLNHVFDGSAKAALLSLFDCKDVSQDELDELRRLINRKARENQK